MRVLVGSDVAVTSPVFADGDTPTDADSTPTCAVTRDDGTTLDAPTVTSTGEAGTYTAALLHDEHTDRLDVLTVVWTGVVDGRTQVYSDTVEVVGGFYVTDQDLLSIRGMEDRSRFPLSLLRATRDEFEDLAESYCGFAMVPRYGSAVIAGCNRTTLTIPWMYPRAIVSADSTDTLGTVTPFTVTNWKRIDYGAIVTDGDTFTASTYGERNITVRVEHGLDRPQATVVRACKLYIQWQLFKDRSQIARDVRQGTTPEGFSTTYSLADWDAGRPTGIAEIDVALNSVGRRLPGVA